MFWKLEKPRASPDFSAIVGMDPYANWVLNPNRGWSEFSRCDDDVFIPFVVTILHADTAKILETSREPHEESDLIFSLIFIPALTPPLELNRLITVYAKRQCFVDLAGSDHGFYQKLREAPKRIKLGLPPKANQQQPLNVFGSGAGSGTPPARFPHIEPDQGATQAVVIGVIDDGIAFANDRFRSGPTTTRIAYFWQQDGLTPGSFLGCGREISAVDINTLLYQNSEGGIVNEDSVYAQFGSINYLDADDHKPVAQRYAHGTHVLDLAAGSALDKAPPDRPIIAVQLPVATTADTSGSTLEVYVKSAFDYIVNRAATLTNNSQPFLPIVINLSYGLTAGPHDGSSVIEQDIEDRVADKTRNLTFVLPAGNAQLSRDHARVCWNGNAGDPDEDPAVLPWRLLPNGLTVSQLEIWLPRSVTAPTGNRVLITVATPGGLESDQLGETNDDEIVLYDDDGVTVVGWASYFVVPGPSIAGSPTYRGLFLMSLRPTEHLRPTPVACGKQPDAPAGVWEVRIYKGEDYNGEDVEAWIQRNDTPFGYPIRGRQSYFDECSYVRYDPVTGRPVEEDPATSVCHVKRVSLINALATSCSPVVVGGVFRQELCSAEYSAGGPTWTYCDDGGQRMRGPDVSAVSDDSRIHRAVLGAGSRSGSAFALSGTSVSTPQIARLAAGLAAGAGGREIGRDDVVAVAEGDEAGHPGQWPPLEPSREGQGRIILPSDRPRRIE